MARPAIMPRDAPRLSTPAIEERVSKIIANHYIAQLATPPTSHERLSNLLADLDALLIRKRDAIKPPRTKTSGLTQGIRDKIAAIAKEPKLKNVKMDPDRRDRYGVRIVSRDTTFKYLLGCLKDMAGTWRYEDSDYVRHGQVYAFDKIRKKLACATLDGRRLLNRG